MARSREGFRAWSVSVGRTTGSRARHGAVLLVRWAGHQSRRTSQWARAALARAAAGAVGPRPALEALEGRQLLSAVSFHAGVLTLIGDPGIPNSLSVELGNGILGANANGHSRIVNSAAVTRISISGGQKNDFVYINPQIHVPATISTFAGDDTIKGGGGLDSIVAGDGNDLIYGSGTILAGNGNDEIHVGSIGSTVQTGNGNDCVIGGPGNDILATGSGYSTLIGGAGNDTMYGGAHTVYPDLSPGDSVPFLQSKASPAPAPAPVPPPANTGSTVSNGPEDATVTGSNHGDRLAPTPVIQVMGVSGPAEHSVFVHALSSVLGAGTPLTAKYQWNFGDPGSRFNVLPGWNAGHIYSNPGTYTITLAITNEAGRSSTLTTQVVVTASTRRTLYVDAYGNDANSGLSTSQPIRSLARVNALLADNTTVLFRRGEVFSFGDDSITVFGRNIVFSAYGSGAAPVLMKTPGAGKGMFGLTASADQVVIENFTFDSVYKPVGNIANHITATGVFPGGRNITVRNNTFLNMDDAIDAYRSPTGMLVQDNSAPLTTGLRGYLEYIDGTDQVIVGNYVANSTREHILRSTDDPTQRILIAGNNLDNISRNNVDPADFPKTTINVRAGHYFYIAGNTLSDAMIGLGPGPDAPANWSAENIVIDGNTLHNAQIYAGGNVHHLEIRNNLLDIEGMQQIWLRPSDPQYASRMMSDVTIENNTGIGTGPIETFLQLDGNSAAGIVTVRNNFFADPNLLPGYDFAATVVVHAWDTSAFRLFSHNVWAAGAWSYREYPGAVNFVAPILDYRQFRTAAEWNAQPNVQDDQFRQISVSGNSLQVAIDGQMAGAVLPGLLA